MANSKLIIHSEDWFKAVRELSRLHMANRIHDLETQDWRVNKYRELSLLFSTGKIRKGDFERGLIINDCEIKPFGFFIYEESPIGKVKFPDIKIKIPAYGGS